MKNPKNIEGIDIHICESIDMEDKIISIGDASRLIGVCQQTLRNWDKQHVLVPIKTVGKHRRYHLLDIIKIRSGEFFDKSKQE